MQIEMTSDDVRIDFFFGGGRRRRRRDLIF